MGHVLFSLHPVRHTGKKVKMDICILKMLYVSAHGVFFIYYQFITKS